MSQVIPAELSKRAHGQLDVAILEHEDQLRGLKVSCSWLPHHYKLLTRCDNIFLLTERVRD
jgi:hypothetical protein